jgi:flagellin
VAKANDNFTVVDGAGTPFADTLASLSGLVGASSTVGTGGTFHVGPNTASADDISVQIGDTDATALGVGSLSLSGSATGAITAIDTAIASVSSTRSSLGALQNRFEHTIANLSVASENLSASESRIRDTDMAQEMVAFTRTQILTQAGTAMLAQANQSQQSVLQLLR